MISPRLPLGDAYAGECRASNPSIYPDEERLRVCCNTGYSRGRCDLFPENTETDAIRFNIAEDSAQLIRIQYIFEKNCWPAEQGTLMYLKASQKLAGESDEIVHSQAIAFVDSFLRRKA